MPRISCSCLTPAFHLLRTQVKWGADYLINAHVEEYVFMGSMGNQTEGERCFSSVFVRAAEPKPLAPSAQWGRMPQAGSACRAPLA